MLARLLLCILIENVEQQRLLFLIQFNGIIQHNHLYIFTKIMILISKSITITVRIFFV